jgi:hypothetical protein
MKPASHGLSPNSENWEWVPRRLADIAELAPWSGADLIQGYRNMLAGYLLGLETARVLLAAQPRADSPERS